MKTKVWMFENQYAKIKSLLEISVCAHAVSECVCFRIYQECNAVSFFNRFNKTICFINHLDTTSFSLGIVSINIGIIKCMRRVVR